MEWQKESKYYVTWDEFIEMHPDLDERNRMAAKDRFEQYQEQIFRLIFILMREINGKCR